MAMARSAGNLLRGIAGMVLGIDNTAVPREQMEALYSYTSRFNFDTDTKNLKELVGVLKRKHLVDSICISYNNGSCLVSTNGNDLNEAITGSALFSYIRSEIPTSKAVMIKGENGWYMLMPHSDKIYIIRAGAELNSIEIRAIAKEVEQFLERKKSEADG